MQRARELVQASATLVIWREYDDAAHEDGRRRGAYLVLRPGQVPEIILDGLAGLREQEDAADRCRRELQEAMLVAEMTGGAKELTRRRRTLVKVERELVVSRGMDPEQHADPARRGACVIVEAGKLPEIVLDGLADAAEQEVAEARCRRELGRRQDPAARLREALRRRSAPPRRPG